MDRHNKQEIADAFAKLNETLLAHSFGLCQEWFPKGKKHGNEFFVGNIHGDAGKSMAINLRTGVWRDFSNPSDTGSDLISLLAARDRITQMEAAQDLCARFALDIPFFSTGRRGPKTRKIKELPPPPPENDEADDEPEYEWRQDVLPETFKHRPARTQTTYVYTNADGKPITYFHRVLKADGGKYFVPETMQVDTDTGELVQVKMAPPKGGRPLYRLPDILDAAQDKWVVVVEGEKAADALKAMFPKMVVTTWMNGGHGFAYCDLEPLRGRRIVIWPDNDPPTEKRPDLPGPGFIAMHAFARHLTANLDCAEIRMVDVTGLGPKDDAADVDKATAGVLIKNAPAWEDPDAADQPAAPDAFAEDQAAAESDADWFEQILNAIGEDEANLGRLHSDETVERLARETPETFVLRLAAMRAAGIKMDGLGTRVRARQREIKADEIAEIRREKAKELEAVFEEQDDQDFRPIDLNDIPTDAIQAMRAVNATYFMLSDGGKTYVGHFDTVRGRQELVRSTVTDFKNLVNSPVVIDTGDGTKVEPIGELWHRSRFKRVFTGVGTYITSDCPPSHINLWRGWPYEPKEGDWSLMKDHLYRIICAENAHLYLWLIAWCARAVQRPEEPAGTAFVMTGPQGAGKGTFARYLGELFGRGYYHVTRSGDVTHKFATWKEGCIFAFIDESVFAGDPSVRGELKAMVTEPRLTVEGKGMPIREIENRLHMVFATNEDHAVWVEQTDRRWTVTKVSGSRIGDFAYFDAIEKEWKNGGREAMLHDLMKLDLQAYEAEHDLNSWRVVETGEREVQKKLSLPPHVEWLLGRIDEEDLLDLKGAMFGETSWPELVSTTYLHQKYCEYMRGQGRPISLTRFGIFLSELGFSSSDQHKDVVVTGEVREHGAWLPVKKKAKSRQVPTVDQLSEIFRVKYGIS